MESLAAVSIRAHLFTMWACCACRDDCIGSGHLAEPVGARFRASFEGVGRHGDDAELRPLPQVPLEIIEQAPDEVAPQVEAFLDAAMGALERVAQERDPLGVVIGGDAIL